MNRSSYISINRQRGAMTILISLIILTLITLVSLYTAKTVTMERKITSNDSRSKMAFEAAEAGLEAAIAYSEIGGFDQNSDSSNSAADELIFEGSGLNALVATDGSGTSRTKVFANGASVTVTLGPDSDVENAEEFTIVSLGVSDDGVATRTIESTVSKVNPLATAPNTPFTARGGLTIDGAVTINNPEGFGTIVTGGTANLTSNGNMSTTVASKSSSNWPACSGGEFKCSVSYAGCNDTEYVKCPVVESASKTATMGDVIDGETTLADMTGDEFFRATFGVTKTIFKEQVADDIILGANFSQLYTANPKGAKLATNKILWVEGDVTDNGTTVGCSAAVTGNRQKTAGEGYGSYDTPCIDAGTRGPVIMVINGDFTTNGTKLWGLLYVIGDVDVAGNPEIVGAAIVENDGMSLNGAGNMDIWYDSSVLRDAGNLGPTASTSGSWKDF